MSLPTQFVTIVIPVLNEAKIIEDCLNSVICQEYPKELMEILVVDGMSNDGTRDIVNRMKEKDARIFLLDNSKKHVPSALNIGIRKARGSIIVRMDSHSVYTPHYVSTLVEKMVELDAWNVGGVLITTPANDSVKCLAIATCLSHPFGVGSSLFRIGSTSIVETDTVPFGCFKKSLFEKKGGRQDLPDSGSDHEILSQRQPHQTVQDVLSVWTVETSCQQKSRQCRFLQTVYTAIVCLWVGFWTYLKPVQSYFHENLPFRSTFIPSYHHISRHSAGYQAFQAIVVPIYPHHILLSALVLWHRIPMGLVQLVQIQKNEVFPGPLIQRSAIRYRILPF